jgi:hypothetical protein
MRRNVISVEFLLVELDHFVHFRQRRNAVDLAGVTYAYAQ